MIQAGCMQLDDIQEWARRYAPRLSQSPCDKISLYAVLFLSIWWLDASETITWSVVEGNNFVSVQVILHIMMCCMISNSACEYAQYLLQGAWEFWGKNMLPALQYCKQCKRKSDKAGPIPSIAKAAQYCSPCGKTLGAGGIHRWIDECIYVFLKIRGHDDRIQTHLLQTCWRYVVYFPGDEIPELVVDGWSCSYFVFPGSCCPHKLPWG